MCGPVGAFRLEPSISTTACLGQRGLARNLWNLLPADPDINRKQKRQRLPSPSALDLARKSTILDWWNDAYARRDEASRSRFLAEAASSLPLRSPHDDSSRADSLRWGDGEANGNTLGSAGGGVVALRQCTRHGREDRWGYMRRALRLTLLAR